MQHLDNGEYDAALEEFSQMLQENPRDSRALEGIRRARAGVISGRLLSVRFARLGGNNEQALEMLRQIVADEKKWGVYPAGAVFSTQRAETEEGIHHFSNTIDSYLADQHPLAARLYFEKYRDIFWQESTLSATRDLQERISRTGRSSCSKLLKDVNRDSVYFREFAERYCRYWGSENAMTKATSTAFAGIYYGAVALDANISNLPQESGTGLLREKLQLALESSPYFDPRSSNTLNVQLVGRFASSMQDNIVNLEHSYFDREPYTEYSEVKKQRSIPYDELVRVSTSSEKVIMRRIKTEEYTEQRAVTKYRRIAKIHAFIGSKYSQALSLRLDGQTLVEGHKVDLNLVEGGHRDGVAHDLELPEIGLHRQPRQLIEPVPWLREKAALLGIGFSEKLDNLWFDLYCTPALRGTVAVDAELVHKCRRSRRGADSEIVVRWFQSQFGVSPSQALLAFSN